MIDISVIIPIYNSEKYLKRCLTSLHVQNVSAEFICVDDGSKDDSSEIVKEFSVIDSRFNYVRSEHKGAGGARNIGLDLAIGKYVCFVDSDDYFKKGALKTLLKIAEYDNCDVVKFNAKVVHGEPWMRKVFLNHNVLIDNFSVNDIFSNTDLRPFIWTHFIKRDTLRGVRFNNTLSLGEDQEFIIKYMCNVKRVRFYNRRLYVHYCHPDSSYYILKKKPNEMCLRHIDMV